MPDAAHSITPLTVLRVLIVDDQPLVRQGLTNLLALEDDLEIVGQAENGLQAIEMVAQLRPDVVLMDIRMPVLSGIAATAKIKGRGGPPVVLLTTFEEVDDMTAGLNAGAAGYLFKSAEIEEIHDALRRVCQGERVIHPRVAAALAQHLVIPPLPAVNLEARPTLTEREMQVLRGMAVGFSNRRIADHIGIGMGTVKVHAGNVLDKLGAENRVEAVIKARRWGILID